MHHLGAHILPLPDLLGLRALDRGRLQPLAPRSRPLRGCRGPERLDTQAAALTLHRLDGHTTLTREDAVRNTAELAGNLFQRRMSGLRHVHPTHAHRGPSESPSDSTRTGLKAPCRVANGRSISDAANDLGPCRGGRDGLPVIDLRECFLERLAGYVQLSRKRRKGLVCDTQDESCPPIGLSKVAHSYSNVPQA
jgi:hypothetical protein